MPFFILMSDNEREVIRGNLIQIGPGYLHLGHLKFRTDKDMINPADRIMAKPRRLGDMVVEFSLRIAKDFLNIAA